MQVGTCIVIATVRTGNLHTMTETVTIGALETAMHRTGAIWHPMVDAIRPVCQENICQTDFRHGSSCCIGPNGKDF